MSLDPVSTALRADLGWTLYYSGRPREALAECRRTFADAGFEEVERALGLPAGL